MEKGWKRAKKKKKKSRKRLKGATAALEQYPLTSCTAAATAAVAHCCVLTRLSLEIRVMLRRYLFVVVSSWLV